MPFPAPASSSIRAREWWYFDADFENGYKVSAKELAGWSIISLELVIRKYCSSGYKINIASPKL